MAKRVAVCAFVAAAVLRPACVEAAVKYRFSSIAEGSYARTVTGTTIVDGDRWRIDYDRDPDTVSDVTSISGSADGSLIALNDENHTWFRLPSRDRLAADASLFSYVLGEKLRVSKAKVSAEPQGVSFSYRIEMDVGGEKVRGDVWGRVHVATSDIPIDLPWRPLDIHSGVDAVDAALAKLNVRVSQCEIEVSRRLENGATLTQKTRRTVSDFTTLTVPASTFAIPASYRYQEPVLGVPGDH